jgi:hypothetical protein
MVFAIFASIPPASTGCLPVNDKKDFTPIPSARTAHHLLIPGCPVPAKTILESQIGGATASIFGHHEVSLLLR